MQFLGDEEYSNTRIFDRRKSEYSNSGSQCQLSPLLKRNKIPGPPAQVVRALLMTSKVPGSSPGGSGIFSLFRQFTSPTDPLNL